MHYPMTRGIIDRYYCNTDLKNNGKFVTLEVKHLDALENANIPYHQLRSVETIEGVVYLNVAVNIQEHDKALAVVKAFNARKKMGG